MLNKHRKQPMGEVISFLWSYSCFWFLLIHSPQQSWQLELINPQLKLLMCSSLLFEDDELRNLLSCETRAANE